jgi:RNA polymerase sigma-70 factor (ECF subfamily)
VKESGVDQLSDESLMKRVGDSDDAAAFAEIFRRYAQRLNGYFLRSTGDPHASQDLVQQTFQHLHRARNDYNATLLLRPWLYTIAANMRRMHHRRLRRKPEVTYEEAHEQSVGPHASTIEQRTVRRAILQLPENQREVLILHWYEGMSMSEVGEILGASTSAVKVRAHRAYKVLQRLLREADD